MIYFWAPVSIFLAITIFAPACSQNKASQSSTWSVQLNSSGGIAGIGAGNVLVSSDGQITYEKPARPNNPTSPCKGTLAKEELRQFGATVAQTKPDGWKVPGLEIAVPDAFGYKLTLRRGKEISEVSWFDNTRDKLPEDLKGLVAAISEVKEKQSKQCDK